MSKFRLIPTVLYKNNSAIRGKKFESWRTVGSILQSIRLFSLREVDELIFLDVNATNKKQINYNLIDKFADECFMPIIIGGGIRSLYDIENLLKVGADRVSINSAFYFNDNFIKEAVNFFGSQCLVLSIDYKKINGKKIVQVLSGSKSTGIELNNYLKKAEQFGITEILLTSIDHDGMMNGCDIETIIDINENFNFKVIPSGGVGKAEHIYNIIKKTNVDSVSCSSIFQFTNTTPMDVKNFLKKKNINVRV